MSALLKALGLSGIGAAVAKRFKRSTPVDDASDAAGAAPGEALADQAEGPHAPTTPDNPLVTVELDED